MALYVDPGSGLLALQSAASLIAAAAFFLRKRIRALFVSRRKVEGINAVAETKQDVRKAA
jgi:hypothetical protein